MSLKNLTRVFAMGGYAFVILLCAVLAAFLAFVAVAVVTESLTVSLIAAAISFLCAGAMGVEGARER